MIPPHSGRREGVRVVAGRFRGLRLETPPGSGVRPTADRVKEALFSILGPRWAGSRVVDLFAGTGALGIEALSRGAERVAWVETDPGRLGVIERNLVRLDVRDRVLVIRGDALVPGQWLPEVGPVDLILADPPYHQGQSGELLRVLDPGAVLRAGGSLVIEHEAGLSLSSEEWAAVDRRRYGDTGITILEPATTDRKA